MLSHGIVPPSAKADLTMLIARVLIILLSTDDVSKVDATDDVSKVDNFEVVWSSDIFDDMVRSKVVDVLAKL